MSSLQPFPILFIDKGGGLQGPMPEFGKCFISLPTDGSTSGGLQGPMPEFGKCFFCIFLLYSMYCTEATFLVTQTQD